MSLQSISYTDWLNSVLTSDSLGEVILAVLPQICHTPQYMKRTLERRFVSIKMGSLSFPMLMLINLRLNCCKHRKCDDLNNASQLPWQRLTFALLMGCDEKPTVTFFLPRSARLLHIAGAS